MVWILTVHTLWDLTPAILVHRRWGYGINEPEESLMGSSQPRLHEEFQKILGYNVEKTKQKVSKTSLLKTWTSADAIIWKW